MLCHELVARCYGTVGICTQPLVARSFEYILHTQQLPSVVPRNQEVEPSQGFTGIYWIRILLREEAPCSSFSCFGENQETHITDL